VGTKEWVGDHGRGKGWETKKSFFKAKSKDAPVEKILKNREKVKVERGWKTNTPAPKKEVLRISSCPATTTRNTNPCNFTLS